jgi:hypothetical protein
MAELSLARKVHYDTKNISNLDVVESHSVYLTLQSLLSTFVVM